MMDHHNQTCQPLGPTQGRTLNSVMERGAQPSGTKVHQAPLAQNMQFSMKTSHQHQQCFQLNAQAILMRRAYFDSASSTSRSKSASSSFDIG